MIHPEAALLPLKWKKEMASYVVAAFRRDRGLGFGEMKDMKEKTKIKKGRKKKMEKEKKRMGSVLWCGVYVGFQFGQVNPIKSESNPMFGWVWVLFSM